MNKVYVGGSGNPDAKLVILGEKVGFWEAERKTPFAGPAGNLLREFCKDAGIDISQCYLTNVIKYPVGQKTTAKELKDQGIDRQQCINDVIDEIRQIKPSAVLALGNLAMEAMVGIRTGITK